jgi:hypothetical protein
MKALMGKSLHEKEMIQMVKGHRRHPEKHELLHEVTI